jgi:hypothetical protein
MEKPIYSKHQAAEYVLQKVILSDMKWKYEGLKLPAGVLHFLPKVE